MEENDNPWLTVAGAARYLGFSVSTIIRWSDAGELPHIRTRSGYRRFSKNDLDAYIEEHRYRGKDREGQAAKSRTRRSGECA